MKTKDVLIAAREMIARPEAWTTETLAADEYGDSVEPAAPDAICWCMEGAVSRVACQANADGVRAYDAYHAAIERLRLAIGDENVYLFNDAPDTTHPAVLAVFDRAIAECPDAA